MHQLKKSACGLIEGKPVNTRVLNFRLVHAKPSAWLFRPARLTCEISAVPNPDLEIKGGGGGASSRPLDKGGPVFKKNFFPLFGPQFGLKTRGEGRGGRAPPLDPPLK